jgi:nitrogen regulatory protein P-II 2
MQLVERSLVTIVAEAVLEQRVILLLEELRVSGYSLSRVRGDRGGSIRASDWEGENLKFEVILTEEGASKLMQQLSERFFEKQFAAIAYLTRIQVLRGSRFTES